LLSAIQGNGATLPKESILNFVGPNFTFTDDPGNTRTNVILPALLPLAGGTMTGPLILSGDPVTALQAATKEYVDSVGSGLTAHTNCVNTTTGANLTAVYNNGAAGVGATLTNSGAQAAFSLDGHANSVNDRVLIKDQTSAFQNGIYTVTTVGTGATNWVLTRATDFDQAAAGEVAVGAYTVISQGTLYAASLWVETGPGPFTIGTTPIVFSLWSNLANLSATAPLVLTGNVLSLTSPLPATNGGTGVSNSNTITLGGNITTGGAFVTSGASSLTLTTTGITNVTLPLSGTLITSGVTSLPSLVTVGTIGTGTWNGTIISPIYGGTGVNNGSSTLTLGGNLSTVGAFPSIFNMTGSTNITFPTSGTLATTSQIPSFPLSLANGGTNANLVASNGGIFYSTASAGAILAGTATAHQVLLSGSSTTPLWSTATYPVTTTINQLLYSSAANTIVGLATGNNGVLVTSAGGVPSISSTLPAAVLSNITTVGTLTGGSLGAGFTPVTVPLGGTGNTTFTAYSVICAGTTATGTFQNVSGVGTANQVLVSNGAGALPSWQATPMPSGSIIQTLSTTLTTTFTSSAASYVDTVLTLTITPSNAGNSVLVRAMLSGGSNPSTSPIFQIVRGATPIGIGTSVGSRTAGGAVASNTTTAGMNTVILEFLDAPATTSATTYKIQMYSEAAAANAYLNRSDLDTNTAGFPRVVSTLTVHEVHA
jgi:hypothetical protein